MARDLSKSQYYKTTTGGTTGNQLNILLQNNSQAIETAFIHRLWSRVGYSYRHKKASFRGVTFNKLDVQAPWQKNPVYNEMQFSPFHLSEINLQKYFAEFRIYRPNYFHGYASAIDVLAEYALAPQMGLAGKSTLDFGQWPQIPSLWVIRGLHQPFHGDLRWVG